MQRRIIDIRNEIAGYTARTVWDKGVRNFATDMFNKYIERRELGKTSGFYDDTVRVGKITEQDLLNGAKDWNQYSHNGYCLRSNRDICRALCILKEQKRTHNGELPPNEHEDWFDIQAAALQQASLIVIGAVNRRNG